MQPHQKTPAGVQPAGASEQNKQHNANDGVLGTCTSDEAHEHHIRQLGDAMAAAWNDGDRSEAKRYQDLMYRALAARSPREVQRRLTEIDKAIERSTTVLAHAIPEGGWWKELSSLARDEASYWKATS